MPDACVLDTSVASLFLNGSLQAAPYRPHLLGVEPVLSFQVVSEMRHGALLKGWGSAKQTLLEQFIGGFRILYPDDALLWEWARVMTTARKAGRRLEAADAWVAATASFLNAPLLTHDRDFDARSCPSLTIIRYAL